MTNGLLFTQEGVSIPYSADYQRVVDTRWKTMDVAFEQDIDISFGSWTAATRYNIEVFAHNLHYLPAFEFFQDRDTSEGNTTILSGSHVIDFMFGTKDKIIVSISRFGGDPSTALRIKGFLRIYRVDITSEYKVSEAPSTGAPAVDSSYGVKFIDTENGFNDLNAKEIYKYLQNSKEKVIGIHQHGTASIDIGSIVINHGIGYPPSYEFTRVNGPSNYYVPAEESISPFNINQGRVTTFPFKLTFSGSQSPLAGKYAYILFKDPAEIAS